MGQPSSGISVLLNVEPLVKQKELVDLIAFGDCEIVNLEPLGGGGCWNNYLVGAVVQGRPVRVPDPSIKSQKSYFELRTLRRGLQRLSFNPSRLSRNTALFLKKKLRSKRPWEKSQLQASHGSSASEVASTTGSRIILHCDLDAFYPSCEIKRNPALADKPLIVGADPKGGHGRGVVMSCSYEARKFGVRSGMPISQAYKLCPQGIYVPPDFELYGETSDLAMEVLRRFADKFEQTSIDEAFLDIGDRCKNYDDATRLAQNLKTDLKQSEGLTVSVGVAPNKSIAKIASDMKKPDGLTVVRPDEVRAFLDPLPVSKISGVGKKTTEYLLNEGIQTIGQLSKVPAKKLTDWFGKGGVWLWGIANGIEETPVEERGLRKSISVEQTFERDIQNKQVVLEALESLVKEVHARLLAEKLFFRTVSIKVRFEGFQTFTRDKTHTGYVDDVDVVREYVHLLFREFEKDRRRIRLVGAKLSDLKPAEGKQTRLG
jgi:DNA polymerase IV (archaeal DinB-like DNA polymerase)